MKFTGKSLNISGIGGSSEREIALSLVIPTFNERENIGILIINLCKLLDQEYQNSYEIVVVDDDSPDGTAKFAETLQTRYPQLSVIQRKGGRSLSAAVVDGWQRGKGQILGVMDGDLQHPPETLSKMLDTMMRENADLVVATRYAGHGAENRCGFLSRVASYIAKLSACTILPKVAKRVSDPMSGYFLVKRKALTGRTLNPIGYKILLEVLDKGGIHRIAEVDYAFQRRREGKSKVNWKIYTAYFIHLMRLRFRS